MGPGGARLGEILAWASRGFHPSDAGPLEWDMRRYLTCAAILALIMPLAGGCEDAGGEEDPNPMDQQTVIKDAKVRWLPWGPEVFAQAQQQDKLIVLDSGATWCH